MMLGIVSIFYSKNYFILQAGNISHTAKKTITFQNDYTTSVYKYKIQTSLVRK